jgi:hypothetical protein
MPITLDNFLKKPKELFEQYKKRQIMNLVYCVEKQKREDLIEEFVNNARPDQDVFEFLEYILICDPSFSIRIKALFYLVENYPVRKIKECIIFAFLNFPEFAKKWYNYTEIKNNALFLKTFKKIQSFSRKGFLGYIIQQKGFFEKLNLKANLIKTTNEIERLIITNKDKTFAILNSETFSEMNFDAREIEIKEKITFFKLGKMLERNTYTYEQRKLIIFYREHGYVSTIPKEPIKKAIYIIEKTEIPKTQVRILITRSGLFFNCFIKKIYLFIGGGDEMYIEKGLRQLIPSMIF